MQIICKNKIAIFLISIFFSVNLIHSEKIIIDQKMVGEVKIGMPFKTILGIIGKQKCDIVDTHKLRKILKCKYGMGTLTLCFVSPHWFRFFNKEPIYKNDLTLSDISTQDPFYKTKHGFGVDSEYLEIIRKYKSLRIKFKETDFGSIWVPSFGLELSGNSYDTKKDKFIQDPGLIFKSFPITSLSISSTEFACELGD